MSPKIQITFILVLTGYVKVINFSEADYYSSQHWFLPINAGALQGSMSMSLDCFFGITRLRSSSTLKGDSYLRPARIFDSTGGPVPAKKNTHVLTNSKTTI